MKDRILVKHFAEVREEFLKHSKHLDIAKHGNIKGYVREALINEFLKKNLPPIVDFTTGEVIDSDDNRSGQLDIILQSITEPRISLYGDYHIALCDSVIAMIEVKSKLTTGVADGNNGLSQALKTVYKFKSLRRKVPIGEKVTYPNRDQKWSTPSIVFSYEGPELETLREKIDNHIKFHNYTKDAVHKFMPDLIVVLDRGYFLFLDDGWIIEKENVDYYRVYESKEETLVGMFILLCNLIQERNNSSRNSNYLEYLVGINKGS